jgi:hypothetical protein
MRALRLTVLLCFAVLFGAAASAVSLGGYSDIQDAKLDNESISIAGDSIAGEVTYTVSEDIDVLEVNSMYLDNRLLQAEFLNQTEIGDGSLLEKVIYSERIKSRSRNLTLNSSVDAVRFMLERNTENELSPRLVGVTGFNTDENNVDSQEESGNSSPVESLIQFLTSILPF